VLWSFTMTHNSDIWFTTDGRIGRCKYWGIQGITAILWILLEVVRFAGSFIAAMALGRHGEAVGILIGFVISGFQLALLWWLLAYGAKRCHDLGNSGFYQLIPFYLLFMLFQEGDVGDNFYGQNPNNKNGQNPNAVAGITETFKWYRNAAAGMTETFKWYRKAADLGDAESQYRLGVCYANGRGVARDEVEAVKWYRKAAEQGSSHAQYTLGLCYASGIGLVAQDEVDAYAYWDLAGITNEFARNHLAVLEKQMTADQIAAGQKRSKELQKKIGAKIAATQAGK